MAGRDYGKVAARFWTSRTGIRLRGDADAQIVALYLLTCQSSTMYGLYHIAQPTIAHETGRTLEQVAAGLARLEAEGFALYDTTSEMVWVINMPQFQMAEAMQPNDKRIPAIKREIAALRSHPYAAMWWDYYEASYHLGPRAFGGSPKPLPDRIDESPSQAPSEPLPRGIEPSAMPLPSQDQDQNRSRSGAGEEPLRTDRSDRQRFDDSTQSGDSRETPPLEPDSPANLLTLLKATIEADHPDLGMYSPGKWAERDAATFFERIPRASWAAYTGLFRTRIKAFSQSERFRADGWNASDFFEHFNALGAAAQPRKSEYPPIRIPANYPRSPQLGPPKDRRDTPPDPIAKPSTAP